MKKVFYEKQSSRSGRIKYIPVAEYDSDLQDSYPKGTHLVIVQPGCTSRKFKVDPAFAPLIAAGAYATDAMCSAMIKASELQPTKTPITIGQQKAWQKLAKEFGDGLATLQGASTHDIVEAGIKVLEKEAYKLLSNESVKNAYDEFMLVCKLASND